MKQSIPFPSGLTEPIRQLHVKYQADVEHAVQVAALCRKLFTGLEQLHRLGEKELRLLLKAAYLHDIGQFIHERKHHLHSHAIILHDRLLDEWSDRKRLKVAVLALNHRKKMLRMDGIENALHGTLTSLIGMLRIADVLDRPHDQKTRIEEVAVLPDRQVLLRLRGFSVEPIREKVEGKLRLAMEAWGVSFQLETEQSRIALNV